MAKRNTRRVLGTCLIRKSDRDGFADASFGKFRDPTDLPMLATLVGAAALVLAPAAQPPIAVVQRASVFSPALREPGSLRLATTATTSAIMDDFPAVREPSRLIFPTTLTADALDDFEAAEKAKNAKREAAANAVRAKMAAQQEEAERESEKRVEFELKQQALKAEREAARAAKEAARQEALAAAEAAKAEGSALKASERSARAGRAAVQATPSDRATREKPNVPYSFSR